MKWHQKKNGEERIRTRFAWLPIYFTDEDIFVWLERVAVKEVYDRGSPFGFGGWRVKERVLRKART
jgi:hypothetical protein